MAPTASTEPCLDSTLRSPPMKRAKVVTRVSKAAPREATARSASKVSLSSQNISLFAPAGSARRKADSAETVGAR